MYSIFVITIILYISSLCHSNLAFKGKLHQEDATQIDVNAMATEMIELNKQETARVRIKNKEVENKKRELEEDEAILEEERDKNWNRILATSSSVSIKQDPNIAISSTLFLVFDPPNGAFSPTAMGLFAMASVAGARIYYTVYCSDLECPKNVPADRIKECDAVNGIWVESEFSCHPTLQSPSLTVDNPYIQLDTPFLASRNRTVAIIAIAAEGVGFAKTVQYDLFYYVEASDRPSSFAFLVPGPESGGMFLRVGIEMKAQARAQTAGGQEFADFFQPLGVGTYGDQIRALKLNDFDNDLVGFEGGFAINCTNKTHYGILVPYHNGKRFFGKVVRVNLIGMEDIEKCGESYRMESLNPDGSIRVSGRYDNETDYYYPIPTRENACVFVIDLTTLHPNAKGFMRGFAGYPYAFLAPSSESVAVRLNMEDFGVHSTKVVDMELVNPSYGGYSGGFSDGTWTCYCPFRSYTGPVGGLRSKLPVDANSLRVYYHSTVLCINATVFDNSDNLEIIQAGTKSFNLAALEPGLIGFSDAVRVGRYVYFCPMASNPKTFTSKVVRIFLGFHDVGEMLDDLTNAGLSIRERADVLDLALYDENLKGFSAIFNAGQYLYLSPYRNAHEPVNGQRGHGYLTRINMNGFSLKDVQYLNLPITERSQIPSFADTDLRGFYGGFPSGKYVLLVPFFNGVFSGKMVRFIANQEVMRSGLLTQTDADTNVQVLDLAVDRHLNQTYLAYRGGFVSLWFGTPY